jgi:hypothetical protein
MSLPYLNDVLVSLDEYVVVSMKCMSSSGDEAATLPGLYDDVVNIDRQVVPDLPFETELHTPLVGGPHIL